MIININKNDKGFTFPDLLVGMVIIAVVTVAGLEVNELAGKMQKDQQRRLQAIYTAASQIEDLKKYAAQYGILQTQFDTGTHNKTEAVTLPSGYTLSYDITDKRWDPTPVSAQYPFHYKEITVTCGYGQKNVVLRGYVYKIR